MLKKLLTLTLVLVMLSVTAFADPNGGIDAYAEYLYAVSVAVDADGTAIGENGLGGNVTLELAADEDNAAIIVTAVFDGNEFLTASITRDVALTAGATTTTKNITLPTAKTYENDSYTVKFYVWEAATFKPLAAPEVITVEPTVSVWSGVAGEEPENVDGVYQIASGEDLAWFANYVNAGNTTANAALISDIYLNEDNNYVNNWANSEKDFRINAYAGTFDGNGKTIHNLYLEGSEVKTALFATIAGGTVTNFNVNNAKFVSQHNGSNIDNSGVVCGIINGGTISKVNVSGTATAASGKRPYNFGVIAANTLSGTSYITDCSSSVIVDFSSDAGAMKDSQYVGIGGIIGVIQQNSSTDKPTITINNCTNSGKIYAPKNVNVAGIVGNAYRGTRTVTNCTNTGDITGSGTYVGLIIGRINGSVNTSTCTPGGQIVPAN